MLKAFLSPLQVNAQGVNVIKDRQNNLPEANSTNAVFRAMEVSKHVFFKTLALSSGISTHLLTNAMQKADLVQYLQILGCGLNDQNRDSVPVKGKIYFSCPKRPDLLRISTQSHIKGYMRLFDVRTLKLITYLHLMLESKFINYTSVSQ
jgi:hypothetical protein